MHCQLQILYIFSQLFYFVEQFIKTLNKCGGSAGFYLHETSSKVQTICMKYPLQEKKSLEMSSKVQYNLNELTSTEQTIARTILHSTNYCIHEISSTVQTVFTLCPSTVQTICTKCFLQYERLA